MTTRDQFTSSNKLSNFPLGCNVNSQCKCLFTSLRIRNLFPLCKENTNCCVYKIKFFKRPRVNNDNAFDNSIFRPRKHEFNLQTKFFLFARAITFFHLARDAVSFRAGAFVCVYCVCVCVCGKEK